MIVNFLFIYTSSKATKSHRGDLRPSKSHRGDLRLSKSPLVGLIRKAIHLVMSPPGPQFDRMEKPGHRPLPGTRRPLIDSSMTSDNAAAETERFLPTVGAPVRNKWQPQTNDCRFDCSSGNWNLEIVKNETVSVSVEQKLDRLKWNKWGCNCFLIIQMDTNR